MSRCKAILETLGNLTESTNANIGLQSKDGTITYIYSHWDGYLEGVGKVLLDHWSNIKDIKALLKQGDVSILGDNIGKKVEFNGFDSTKNSQCLFYGRDRGETGVKADKTKSRKSFARQEYNYLYLEAEKVWLYSEDYGKSWYNLKTKKIYKSKGKGKATGEITLKDLKAIQKKFTEAAKLMPSIDTLNDKQGGYFSMLDRGFFDAKVAISKMIDFSSENTK